MQHNASSFCELGVQTKYLDSKRDLIGHALAVWLISTPQFKIFWSIVESVTVFVMNAFVFCKWAAESFCHDFSVLKNLFTAPQMDHAVSGISNVTNLGYRSPFASFVTAFSRAKPAFVFVSEALSIRHFKSASNSFLSAMFANECGRRDQLCFASALQRTEFLVRPSRSWNKNFAALYAGFRAHLLRHFDLFVNVCVVAMYQVKPSVSIGG